MSRSIAHGRKSQRNDRTHRKRGGDPRLQSSRPPNAALRRRSLHNYSFTASSQPLWPQWQLKVVIFFASSQCWEQYFLPTGAMQVQAMWAHLTGVFDIAASSKQIKLRASGIQTPASRSAKILLAASILRYRIVRNLYTTEAAQSLPYRLDSSSCRACSKLVSVSFAPESIRATSCARSLSSIRRTLVCVRPSRSAFSIKKC
jgi:hypothetical protein